MRVEERLRAYPDLLETVYVDEGKLMQTILVSKEALYRGELETPMSGMAFVFQQAGFIRKRWWIAQALILLFLWGFLFMGGTTVYTQRCMGITAPVFVILLMPELWKSQHHGAMEIEAVSYFSIQKVYAARMLLFAMIDVLLLTLFLATSVLGLRLVIGDMIVQFFLPMNVTCCICFRSLCSNRTDSGYIALAMSMVWTMVWLLVVLQENVYRSITAPVWAGAVLLSAAYFIFSIWKVWKCCGQYWEVKPSWS